MSGDFELRPIAEDELDAAIALERRCYAPEAAATPEGFRHRFLRFGDFFWSAWSGGELVGIANGIRTSQSSCGDEMKGEQADDARGVNFCVLTVAVNPEYRRRGIGTLLLRRLVRQCEASGIRGMILMCEKHLIPFYEAERFERHGVSSSTHGGIEWHEMSRRLHTMEHLT
ncbi:GNAT family N-acetyltransferase [Paenibacillus arenilitoris]|uniref:GNAT family N-acetyltransferase n=1 Tax=Paenibacillus arenilitoris TaxID=2772299 RepID=A0A927H6R9_9BACL|nr:GNAT family N-acetyltransferase [Paenibacillus arenilitoris]MBD2869777.1 GNAT family N-acetyltransferase [Paenibacillus arenilitoris]